MGHNSSKKQIRQSLNRLLRQRQLGKQCYFMLFYVISSVISLAVNGLYNIVDKIFIGQGIGYLGNSTTNVIFPLPVFASNV